jgi:hypothetical protein
VREVNQIGIRDRGYGIWCDGACAVIPHPDVPSSIPYPDVRYPVQ